MTESDRDCLLKKIDRLRADIMAQQQELMNRWLDHLDYHKKNEAKWGIIKIMRNHPWRVLMAGITIGSMIAGSPLTQRILRAIIDWLK